MDELTRINLVSLNEEISRKEIIDVLEKAFPDAGFHRSIKFERHGRRVVLLGNFRDITEKELQEFLVFHHWSDGSKCSALAK